MEEDRIEFTPEEKAALKEIAKDRLAVSRVWGRLKALVIGLGGFVAAYILLADNFFQWVRIRLGMN